MDGSEKNKKERKKKKGTGMCPSNLHFWLSLTPPILQVAPPTSSQQLYPTATICIMHCYCIHPYKSSVLYVLCPYGMEFFAGIGHDRLTYPLLDICN